MALRLSVSKKPCTTTVLFFLNSNLPAVVQCPVHSSLFLESKILGVPALEIEMCWEQTASQTFYRERGSWTAPSPIPACRTQPCCLQCRWPKLPPPPPSRPSSWPGSATLPTFCSPWGNRWFKHSSTAAAVQVACATCHGFPWPYRAHKLHPLSPYPSLLLPLLPPLMAWNIPSPGKILFISWVSWWCGDCLNHHPQP